MGRYNLEYPKEAINSVKRLGERGNYELEKIHGLINSSQIVSVSFNPPDSPFPTILPMIGQMGSFDRPSADLGDPLDLYIHGYVSSRIMNLGRKATNEGEKDGMPVCVSVSQVDGIVLALSAFHSSYNYRSASLFGYASLVEDPEEKLWAMELITNSVVPGRWNNTRLPPTNGELQSTSILRVKITAGSAKIREGNASDDKPDMQNKELVDSVWTGVVPMASTMGEPVASSYNEAPVPEYLAEYRKGFNEERQELSTRVAKP